jgi:Ca-activated chloride channel family protein
MGRHVRVLTVALLLLVSGAATACVVIPPPPPRPDIAPLYLEVKSQRVESSITDQVARVTVTTVLHNPHDSRVEGTFLYPLPPEAAVSDFSYWMGDKEMKGELLDRDKARRIYEDIVRSLRDPALLEYDGGGLFKARIFPVEPRSDVQTKLQFTQVLKADSGVIAYSHAVKLGRTRPNRGDLVINVGIRSQVPIKAVYSPTHQVDVVRKGDNSVSASVEVDDTDFAVDFQLYYTLGEKDFGLNALTHREAGEPGYFMLLLSPKQDWGEREIEGKDLVLALDTSGSMTGKKIEQAQAALKQVLQGLKPRDRFGLLTFATETRHFSDKLMEASEANVAKATDFVAGLEAKGSTALNDALVEAVELSDGAGERPSMVMFLTDGLPTQGERDAEKITKNVAKANGTAADDEGDERKARMFIFGVGDDVNTHLLDRIAEGNGGATTYVRPSEDIEAAVSNLYAKLSHPVLADVKLSIGGVSPHEMYPVRLPDLFVGSQVVVTGRYDGSGQSQVTLSGQAGGERREYAYDMDFPRESEANAFVARVWAVRRIGYLLDEIRLQGEEKELKDEVVRLAVKFGIVTPYTSYLVQEDEDLRRREGLAAAQSGAFQVSDAAQGRGGVPGMPGMGGPAGPAGPAPAAPKAAMESQVGAGAVHAAQSVQGLKLGEQAGEGDQTTFRAVAQRTFYSDGAWWLDSTWEKDLQLVQVRAFSAAYFELLQLRPDLAPCLSLGSQVKVRLGQTGLIVGPEGDEALNAAQRTQLQP